MYTSYSIAQETGLTLDRVISDIPVDPASIAVYLLVAVSIFVIWKGNRNSGRNRDTPTALNSPLEGTPARPVRRGTVPTVAVRRPRPPRTRPASTRTRRNSRGRA